MTAEDILKALKELEEVYTKKIFSDWFVLINPITYCENKKEIDELSGSIDFVIDSLCPEGKAYVSYKYDNCAYKLPFDMGGDSDE